MPRRLLLPAALLAASALARAAGAPPGSPLPAGAPVHGWTILSGDAAGSREVIAAAPAYAINQIELSQEIVDNLSALKDPSRRALVNGLIDLAHEKGISEVAVWDHSLYKLDYYPARFRTGPGRTLDLDNPDFWAWFKADYRRNLDLAPHANAVVLTFIGTDGQVESQSSRRFATAAQREAAVVNAVADVVVGERKLNLYIRIFPNDRPRDPKLMDPVGLIARPEVRLMIKQSPLDYFLTAPSDSYVGLLPHPTLVEFELVGEFNGEGAVINTFIENLLGRWRDLSRRPHFIGYTVRTDRLGDSRLVGKPGEMSLWALKRAAEDPQLTAEQVYDEFIARRYGAAAVAELKPAFKNAFDIVTSAYYTLGSPLSDHSKLDYDLFPAFYTHLISGRWMDPPIAWVGHGVDREFHYWRDVADHLAPPFVKEPSYLARQNITPRERSWYHPGEAMDEEYLGYIVTEKNWGVSLAEDSLRRVERARGVLAPADYAQLHNYFTRTLLTARLQRAVASAYFGFRVWCRGGAFQTPAVRDAVTRGLAEIEEVAPQVRNYPVKPPASQYVWADDAGRAQRYFRLIVKDGWPAESDGVPNPNAGMKFPYPAR